MKVMRGYNQYDSDAASLLSGYVCHTPSRTQQSQAEDTDINVIVKRFGITGQLPTGVRVPQFGDFIGVSDFREAMDAIVLAERSFAAMPSDVRLRFANDPQLFLEFCSDEANLPEMRRLGLAVPAPEAPGVAVGGAVPVASSPATS